VVGHQKELVEQAARDTGVKGLEFAVQKEQKGTGHAVLCALSKLKKYKGAVLILSGDVPLLTKSAVNALKKAFIKSEAPVAFLVFTADNPAGYGRVIKDKNGATAIIEHKDCTTAERKIKTVNAGIYMMDIQFLKRSAARLDADNSQGEFYLTDLVAAAAAANGAVPVVNVSESEVAGVNTLVDMAALEKRVQAAVTRRLMLSGVTISHPETVYIEQGCRIGADTFIGQGVRLTGTTKIGRNAVIEQGVIISDSVIRDNAVIRAYSVIDKADVGQEAEVGPMGRLRPGAVLKRKAKSGNWVELKNTILGEGSKANHLAYLGDGEIGKNVNLGAGCIFCNYDGFLKHKTVIDDDVFVGSDSQLVAPVHVGKGAYVASGSTVVSAVPAGDLAISRVRQKNKSGYGTLLRKRLKARKDRLKGKTGAKK
jgi:bifunctional UDP-N-acetylglucosamine pyrophosphorylase/glucosamine-1-phosphate N-acetyltransferase